ncbi:hypothetical protein IE53DRAFT_386693 [Violaceomyces palustris]|uniref:Uncharacterized protein n=1 Tax=Violaceomyces palustris TaxID=1673888 RepID=A0ACD0NZ21_9BASI|nr:hypothetical protein IE53DRAFT_386693 [Violaceomyces palustris]
MATATITLTAQEEALCDLLHQTCEYIHHHRPNVDGIDLAQQHPQALTTKCQARIAGGWVRDKLLSRFSDDLDISLSTLTGHAFALYLKDYLSSPHFQSSSLASSPLLKTDNAGMGSIGRIAANPEQSKNLETATARVMGLSLDFVNLRKESYEPGSRIPIMSFGTAKEDAERRDITINSLLYNVHTRQVEDHTGLGLRDLQARLIRTPLPPLTTFLDDPLRVLRCVRFASRFSYELHPSIVRCLTGKEVPGAADLDVEMKDTSEEVEVDPRMQVEGTDIGDVQTRGREEIRTALLSKVSRERFGIEVDKMIKGPHPLLALYLIQRLDLFPLIFHPPPSNSLRTKSGQDQKAGEAGPTSMALNAARVLDAVLKKEAASSRAPTNATPRSFSELPTSPLPESVFEAIGDDLMQAWSTDLSAEQRRWLWFSVSLIPLHGLVYEEKKNKLAWAGEAVIANGLKLGAKTLRDPVSAMAKAVELLKNPSRYVGSKDGQGAPKELGIPEKCSTKSQVGLLLRNTNITNPNLHLTFAPAFLFSFICETVSIWSQAKQGFDPDDGSACRDVATSKSLVEKAQEYSAFWARIREWKLDQRAEEKPLLDGNEITSLLGSHGRLIPRIQTWVLAWQIDLDLQDPSLLDPSNHSAGAAEKRQDIIKQCREWLSNEWENGGIIPPGERMIGGTGGGKGEGKAKQAGGKKKGAVTSNQDTANRKRQKSNEAQDLHSV